MQDETFHGTDAGEGAAGVRERFSAVILYDRAEAGRRAMSRLQNVTRPLAADLELMVRLWRLDVLEEAGIARAAWGDLAAADLLLVSLSDEGSLNAGGREVLERAIRRMRSQGTAVAVLPGEAIAQGRSRFHFLQDAAKEAGIGLVFPPVSKASAGFHSAGPDSRLSPVLEWL